MRFRLLPLEPFWFRMQAQATPQEIKLCYCADSCAEITALFSACRTIRIVFTLTPCTFIAITQLALKIHQNKPF